MKGNFHAVLFSCTSSGWGGVGGKTDRQTERMKKKERNNRGQLANQTQG